MSGTLRFAPGETSKTIDVPILGDLVLEPDETVELTLSNPGGAIIGAATALGTIRDDDDHTPPVLTVPATIVIVTTSPAGAVVDYSATATDDHDPNPTVACNPESGSLFPIGTTTVWCAATDRSGNTTQATFEIRVERDLPPTLILPADITTTESRAFSGGATVAYSATAMDDRDVNPTVACAPPSGSFFGVGTTVVSCIATDSAGNQATGSFRITVLRAARSFVPLTVEVVSPTSGGVSVVLDRGVNGTTNSARCLTACTWDLLLNYPTVLTVEGLTAGGPFFQRWEGCDAVDGASCYVTMAGARLVRAIFDTTLPGLAHGACIWASLPRPGQRDVWVYGCIWEWTTGLTGGFLSMAEAWAPYWTAVAFAPSSIDWNSTSLTFDGIGISGLGTPGSATRPNGQTLRVIAA